MGTTQVSSDGTAVGAGAPAVRFRLEGGVIPVAAFDPAKDFRVGLGWRVDAESELDGVCRLAQLTPPGSMTPTGCSSTSTTATRLATNSAPAASRPARSSTSRRRLRRWLPARHRGATLGRHPGHDPEGRAYAHASTPWATAEGCKRSPPRSRAVCDRGCRGRPQY
jgi:hypothetical protein